MYSSGLTRDRAGVLERYGDFECDCFAYASNSKGKSFFSKLDVPGTSGVNFFHQRCSLEWFFVLYCDVLTRRLLRGVLYWCFSPPKVVTEAVQHFARFGATAAVVVPVWANSSFYGMFWPDGVHLAEFVVE